MARRLRVAAAQMAPINHDTPKSHTIARIVDLLREAHSMGAELVVLPELCISTFFARFLITDEAEIDSHCEIQMPGPDTQPIFDLARELRLAVVLGYAELDFSTGSKRRFNTAVLIDSAGTIRAKYRKVHIPGHVEPKPHSKVQNLERRYFLPGDGGFPVWSVLGGRVGMCICNDRRWPETYRVMGLQGVEMILIGYNTAANSPHGEEPAHLGMMHNHLVMQAGAYQNSSYVVAAAKAGTENGIEMIGGSCIISPSGELIAQAQTEGDEIIVANCDLDLCLAGKQNMFNFAAYRRPEAYGLITSTRSFGGAAGSTGSR